MKAEWEAKQFGDVCRFVRGPFGGSLKKSVFVADGFAVYEQQHAIYNQFTDIRYFIDDDKFEEMKRFELCPNDLIMSCSGTMGKVAIVPENIRPGIINQALLKLTPFGSVLPEFLKYWMDSDDFQESLKEQSGGAAIQNVASVAILKGIRILLPPLPEQQRIVDILDEAFAGIAVAKANAEKNLQNARALYESHLQAVFSQGGEGWVEKPLGELCERITKGSSPKWQGISYVERPGILFVTSENVGEYQILMDNPKYVEDKFNVKDKKSILRKGDVLTNIVGASIGRTAVFDIEQVANINQAVCLIRCEPSLLNNYFLAYLLNSPTFKSVLHDNEVNSARANLSLGFFSQLPVTIPTLETQRRIVQELHNFRHESQHLESIYQQKLAALDELKRSLLHKAFSGEL